MNSSDVWTCQQAQDLAPSPRLVTDEDRRLQRRRDRCLLIAEVDEQAMAAWRERFPQDAAAENEFYTQRRALRAADRTDRRERKALAKAQCDRGDASTWDNDDPLWKYAFLSSDYITKEDDNK